MGLARTTQLLVLLGLVYGPRVVLEVLLVVFLGLVARLGLEVVVVGWPFLASQPEDKGGVVLEFGGEVEQFGGKIVVFLVLVELSLTQHENFGVAPQIVTLMLVSPPPLLDPQRHPLLRSVLLPLTRQHPLLYLLISLHLHLLLPLLSRVDQVERVADQTLLDVAVQRRIRCEAGCVVYFQEVGVELMVDHDIKAQHLEAHVIRKVLRMDGGDGSTEGGVARDDGLDDDIVDLLLEQVDIFALVGHIPEHGSQSPLVPHVHVLHRRVENKLGTVLVDGVVGEVHELVVQVLGARRTVLVSSEAGQPFLVDEDAERVDA